MTTQNAAAPSYSWSGVVAQFLLVEEPIWLTALEEHHRRSMLENPSSQQREAWRTCFAVLREQFQALVAREPSAATWHVIFEYELPRERGRRPDVLLLAGSSILVLEFKDFARALQAHIDQVAAYARDLSQYHSRSHDRPCHPILVLTQAGRVATSDGPVWVTGPAELPAVIERFAAESTGDPIDGEVWLDGDYAPLPSLVQAARIIFRDEPLPSIRRAQSAGIPQTLDSLVSAARSARERGELHVALVTGVPGAGKTLVGLQFVYLDHFGDDLGRRTAVFLSGNGPLVKVLQHALKSSAFVQDVHGFLKRYGGTQTRLPEEHVWVYDEAQRAWSADRVSEKRGHWASEPEDFLRLAERLNSWAFVVGLIGEGQEIHLGEEGGLSQWNDAIQAGRRPWHVHCPPKLAPIFSAAVSVTEEGRLDLSASLRTHLAEDVQHWVRLVLAGRLDEARALVDSIRDQGFDLYVTRDLDSAKQYVRERYRGQEDKRYGLLASSKAKNLPAHGVMNDYSFTKRLKEGPWFNDPPDSRFSCCQLRDVATEFACQGLELDFPIIAWGSDLRWVEGGWKSPNSKRSKARDPHQLRVNSYRVLLTRGRDGLVIFVPDETDMMSTYDAIVRAGVQVLQAVPELPAL